MLGRFIAALISLPLLAQTNGTIQGRVTNSVTGEPVGGVKIRFIDRRSYVHDAVTDPSGAYRLTGLADGDYRGGFSKEGFAESADNAFPPSYTHLAGDTPVRVDMQLKPWGSLRGRVVGEDGKPAAGVRVEKEPNKIGTVEGHDALTDQNGEFLFQELSSGSYTVAAKPEAKTRMQDGLRVGNVAIYYPSATEPAQAVRIPVRTGENVTGIEIRLKSVPVHRIAGVVLNEAGKPAPGAIVKLMGRASTVRETLLYIPTFFVNPPGPAGSSPGSSATLGPRPAPEVARVVARSDGSFEFTAVEAGDWRLSAQAGTYDDPLSGIASAFVAEKDIDGIQIRLSPSFSVQVTADWGAPQRPATPTRVQDGRVIATQPATPRLNFSALDGQPSVVGEDPVKNMARMNNVFSGRYRVTGAGLQSELYVAAVMLGGRDVNGQVVELTPGAGPFQLVYKSNAGKVIGKVDRGDGGAVFLISQAIGELLTYRQVACGPGGAYEITQVPPGDYYIAAFDHADGTGLPAADLPASIIPFASSIRVEPSATASVDLRLNKWPW